MGTTDALGRQVLPIPDRPNTGLITYDARDPETSFPPITQLRPPEGAPNVLIVLLDDVGFGASSAFGGPCQTPIFERLAQSGLKYNRFHTTAMCAPTRTALRSIAPSRFLIHISNAPCPPTAGPATTVISPG